MVGWELGGVMGGEGGKEKGIGGEGMDYVEEVGGDGGGEMEDEWRIWERRLMADCDRGEGGMGSLGEGCGVNGRRE